MILTFSTLAWVVLLAARFVLITASTNTYERFQLSGNTKLENGAGSEESCLQKCSQTSNCIGFSFGNDKSCHLAIGGRGTFQIAYNEKWTTFMMKSNSSNQSDQFGVHIKRNIQLLNHKKSINTSSLSECWKSCLKDKSCSAVSNERNSSECFLFGEGSFISVKKKNFVSYFKEKSEQPASTIYDNTRLVDSGNDSSTSSAKTAYECWLKTIPQGSEAISFKDSRCVSFKKKQYYDVEPQTGWTTIALEKLNSLLMSKHRYDDRLLFDSYATKTWLSIEQCWETCVTSLDCNAISYLPADSSSIVGKCLLYKNDDNYGQQQANWTTMSKTMLKQPLVRVSAATCLQFNVETSTSIFESAMPGCLLELRTPNSVEVECRGALARSVHDCWLYCQKNVKDCSALSYDGAKCAFFKSQEYDAYDSPNCVVISLEGEKVLSKTMFEMTETRVTTRYGLMSASSLEQCVEACHVVPQCVGFSFEKSEPTTCHFFSFNFGFAVSQPGWTSYIKTIHKNDMNSTEQAVSLLNVVFGEHYENVVEAASDNQCWLNCIALGKMCIAASFSPESSECLLFKNSTATGAFYQDGWSTYTRKGIEVAFPRIET